MQKHPPYRERYGGLRKIWSFGVPKNAISTWMYHKEKIFCALQETSLSTKKICSCNYKEVDKAVYDWFLLQRSQLIPIESARIKTITHHSRRRKAEFSFMIYFEDKDFLLQSKRT